MELSQFTDYSLRVLIFVAVQDDRRCSVKEVAEAYRISQNHLVKVVHNLGKLGYIETHQGRGGGFALARDAGDINIGEVVRNTESLALVECLSPRSNCCLSGMCGLQKVLGRATGAFLAELDAVTLADLIPQKAPYKKRFLPPSV